MSRLVCSRCGRPADIVEVLEVTATREARVTAKPDGSVQVETWRGPTTEEEEKTTGFECAACGESSHDATAIVERAPDAECRTCGWVGADPAEHPSTCPDEPWIGGPPVTHPGQGDLLAEVAA